jgi:tRNA (guanine37-N1)-methyltransferase
MTISILTLFPEMFTGPFHHSIIKRAQEKNLVTIDLVNIRNFASGRYKSVDDHPYGGGVGMILRADVIDKAINSVTPGLTRNDTHVVLLDPRGKTFTQAKARTYSTLDRLVLICGHYEGVDERVRHLADESVSIGDYILTGGEIPAMVIADSVVRLLPGVLKIDATQNESFSLHPPHARVSNLPILEYPQYTRPQVYRGMKVPEILLSGDHNAIHTWRQEEQMKPKIQRRGGVRTVIPRGPTA